MIVPSVARAAGRGGRAARTGIGKPEGDAMRLASFLSGASDAAFGAAHRNLVLRRRARVLAGRLAGLYPWPASVVLDRDLHFAAVLGVG